MTDSAVGRIVGCVLLLAVLVGLSVSYGAAQDSADQGPIDGGLLAEDYDAHLGAAAVVHGTVVGLDPVVIEAKAGEKGTIQLEIVDHESSPSVGDRLRVYGTVRPDGTIDSRNDIVVPKTGLVYTWSVSFLAGLWVLTRLVQGWRFDVENLAVRPQGRHLGVRELFTRASTSEGSDD
jgi:hypothetical protein